VRGASRKNGRHGKAKKENRVGIMLNILIRKRKDGKVRGMCEAEKMAMAARL
jgi:hypothetical protein